MDGENNGKPYEQMDDLGVFPYFWKHPYHQIFLDAVLSEASNLIQSIQVRSSGFGFGLTIKIDLGELAGSAKPTNICVLYILYTHTHPKKKTWFWPIYCCAGLILEMLEICDS